MQTDIPIKLSIIIPVYNEEKSITILYHKLKKVLLNMNEGNEIIFVNDGSNDSSPQILEELSGTDQSVRVFGFLSNQGQHKAVEKGFHEARGEIIVTLDSDLQNDPWDIPKLLAKMDEGYDVVCGWRANRKDPPFKIIQSKIGNYILSKMTKISLHDMSCGIRAFRRALVKDLVLREKSEITFIPYILSWRKARITEVRVEHCARAFGKSKYKTLPTLIKTIFCYFRLHREGRIEKHFFIRD